MHAALVFHLHLQSFRTDIPRLGLSLFCFWGSFTKRDLFSLFFPIKFLCHGDKSSRHYTWPLYRIQLLHGESVAEPKRDLYIRSLGENDVVCWISESPNHFCILLIGWLIYDLMPSAAFYFPLELICPLLTNPAVRKTAFSGILLNCCVRPTTEKMMPLLFYFSANSNFHPF